MPDYRRVFEPDPQAATVRIFASGEGVRGLVRWPSSSQPDQPSDSFASLIMAPERALSAVTQARGHDAATAIVVQIDDEALWQNSWGRLV